MEPNCSTDLPSKVKRVLPRALWLGSALFFVACQVETTAPSKGDEASMGDAAKPNIVYILADDLGYGDISPFGQTKFKTPNLERMAREGMKFTHHYSGATVCAPSRSALLTGQHGGNTQIRANGGGRDPGTYLAAGSQTLISLMNDAGYKTSVFGKWGMGNYENTGSPEAQGVDYFYGYVEHVPAHNYYPPFITENGKRHTLDNNGIDVHGHSKETKKADPESIYRNYIGNDYVPDLLQVKAKEFIKESKDGPFFMYYASTIPHAALQIPDEALTPFDYPEVGIKAEYYSPHPRPRAARAAMIVQLDKEVGALLDLLEAEGLSDNTLVIFASDNGPAPEGGADMEFFDAAGPYRGNKRDLTEGGIRVPMIARWPGKIKPGQTSEHVTAMWDVLATSADVANIEVKEPTDSISILPTLLGEGDQAEHEYLYWEFHGTGKYKAAQAVRKGDWKAIKPYSKKGGNKAKSGSRAQPMELYNLATDPGETDNLAAQNPELVSEMEDIMSRRKPTIREGWNFE